VSGVTGLVQWLLPTLGLAVAAYLAGRNDERRAWERGTSWRVEAARHVVWRADRLGREGDR